MNRKASEEILFGTPGKLVWVFLLLLLFCPAGAFDWDRALRAAKGAGKLAEAAQGLSPQQERQIGYEVSAMLAASYGLDSAEGTQKYVNLIGYTLWRAAAEKEEEKSKMNSGKPVFGALDTDEILGYSAPGGFVLLSRGAVDACEDEAMLAGAIAHEIAHARMRHVAKAISKSHLVGGLIDLGGAALGEKDRKWLDTLSGAAMDVMLRGLSREDEFAADQEAEKILKSAGYDPSGLRRFLEAAKRRGEQEKAATLSLLRTHPKIEDRISRLKEKEQPDRRLRERLWTFLARRPEMKTETGASETSASEP